MTDWREKYLNKVTCGDCLELMRDLPDGCVDMIWTDPPYGHGNMNGDLQAARIKDNVRGARKRKQEPIENDTQETFRAVFDGMLNEASRVLNRDCCCCCCCCGGGGPKPTFAWVSERMDIKGLSFFHAIVWDKSGRGNGLGWRYRRNYEFIMVAHKNNGKLAWNENLLAVPNIIAITPPIERIHPNEKPVELVEHFIKLHVPEGAIILDPFIGSGTTAVAAIRTGRQFIGFEIDPHYCEIANRRIADEQAKIPIPFKEYATPEQISLDV